MKRFSAREKSRQRLYAHFVRSAKFPHYRGEDGSTRGYPGVYRFVRVLNC